MEIIARKDAIRLRQSRYFTGQPCRQGHLTFRYTKNGGCADCINPKFTAADVEERHALRQIVQATKQSKMTRAGFRLHPSDLEAFTVTVLFYGKLREPALSRSSVIARRGWVNVGEGFQLRQFWIFPQDHDTLLEMEKQLRQSRLDSAALDRAGL